MHDALAYTATLHQSLYLQHYAGKSWDEPSGPDAVGTRPLHRLYRASDGWFFLGGHDSQLAQLRSIADLADLPGMAEAAAFLEARFVTAPVESWVRRIVAAGLGAHHLRPVDEVMQYPRAVPAGLSLTREHVGLGLVRTTGPVPRLSRTPLVAGCPAAPPGSDGAAIRAVLGLPPATVATP